MLVRVRSGNFWLTLPLALFLIDETLEIVADLLWIVNKFIPIGISNPHCGSKRKNPKFQSLIGQGFSPHQVLELCRELLNELRKHGRYSMVEVETGKGSHKQRISVEFF
jgi:hypothetical protein